MLSLFNLKKNFCSALGYGGLLILACAEFSLRICGISSSFLLGNTADWEKLQDRSIVLLLFLGSLEFIIYMEGKVFVSLSCKIRNLL